MKGYNYEENGVPKLTDEFRAKHIINLKGKDMITAVGLMVLGHDKGIKKLTSTIIQMPNKENDMTCIVQAEVIGYGWNSVTKTVDEVVFTELGDANSKNCSSMVAASYIRMASTRAVSRVLKNYTNVGMLCNDEIADSTSQVETMVTAAQTLAVGAIMKKLSISRETAKAKCKLMFKKETTSELTEKEADIFIKVLESLEPTI